VPSAERLAPPSGDAVWSSVGGTVIRAEAVRQEAVAEGLLLANCERVPLGEGLSEPVLLSLTLPLGESEGEGERLPAPEREGVGDVDAQGEVEGEPLPLRLPLLQRLPLPLPLRPAVGVRLAKALRGGVALPSGEPLGDSPAESEGESEPLPEGEGEPLAEAQREPEGAPLLEREGGAVAEPRGEAVKLPEAQPLPVLEVEAEAQGEAVRDSGGEREAGGESEGERGAEALCEALPLPLPLPLLLGEGDTAGERVSRPDREPLGVTEGDPVGDTVPAPLRDAEVLGLGSAEGVAHRVAVALSVGVPLPEKVEEPVCDKEGEGELLTVGCGLRVLIGDADAESVGVSVREMRGDAVAGKGEGDAATEPVAPDCDAMAEKIADEEGELVPVAQLLTLLLSKGDGVPLGGAVAVPLE
jgi:hypothetical protein